MIWVSYDMAPIQSKPDERSLDHKSLEQLKREIVRRRLAGESRNHIAASLQINRTTVLKIYSKYRTAGMKALASMKASGPAPKLAIRQHVRLIGAYIRREYGVVYHETCASKLLHRMGIMHQRHVQRAFNREDHLLAYLKGLFHRKPRERYENIFEAESPSMSNIQSNRIYNKFFCGHFAVEYVRETLHLK